MSRTSRALIAFIPLLAQPTPARAEPLAGGEGIFVGILLGMGAALLGGLCLLYYLAAWLWQKWSERSGD